MYDPPAYIWAITIAGVTAVPLATSAAIHHGAHRAGLDRRRAALITITSAVIFGGWFITSGVISRPRRVPRPTRARRSVAAGRCRRLSGRATTPEPDSGSGTHPRRTRDGEPPDSPTLLPSHRGGVPDPHGHGPPTRLVRTAGGSGRHRHRHRRSSRRTSPGRGNWPPGSPVVQRPRHHRSNRRHDPRGDHRLPTDQRRNLGRADQRTPPRPDPLSGGSATPRPAHHIDLRAAQNVTFALRPEAIPHPAATI